MLYWASRRESVVSNPAPVVTPPFARYAIARPGDAQANRRSEKQQGKNFGLDIGSSAALKTKGATDIAAPRQSSRSKPI